MVLPEISSSSNVELAPLQNSNPKEGSGVVIKGTLWIKATWKFLYKHQYTTYFSQCEPLITMVTKFFSLRMKYNKKSIYVSKILNTLNLYCNKTISTKIACYEYSLKISIVVFGQIWPIWPRLNPLPPPKLSTQGNKIVVGGKIGFRVLNWYVKYNDLTDD